MHVAHLTSSRFFGGPERQMLELAKELRPDIATTFISFSEQGLCRSFLDKTQECGFSAHALQHDTPKLWAAASELRRQLSENHIEVLFCHGYKADLLGWRVARSLGIPAIAVSRGWTGESRKVRVYEWLDRRILRYMDHVVCVSRAQADKVSDAGVPEERVSVIHNAIRCEPFLGPHDPAYRQKLESLFPAPPRFIIGAAGRLSPEKGFDLLIDCCHQLLSPPAPERPTSCDVPASDLHPTVVSEHIPIGFVVYGDGQLRGTLQRQIDACGLRDLFVLAGFTHELQRFMPHFDLFVQSSYSEGLPNVLLEAAAAGVPTVATDVGGTCEVVSNGQTGMLVQSGNAAALANSIRMLITEPHTRLAMTQTAPAHVIRDFPFHRQAEKYRLLLPRIALPHASHLSQQN
jgi:glycosyltransferase involved in cell wall biosynthesis